MPAANPAAARPPAREDVKLIALVGIAHSVSHFSQLLLAPLFPWLKDAFGVGYAELGLLMTIFFVVSCGVQTLSGFLVDRVGPRPVLLAGLALLGTAAFGYSASTSYAMLAAFSVLAGIGNGVFHPVDYTLLNRKVHASRLGHAFSVHGITGSLGWALAPALLVPLTIAYSWRVALVVAGVLAWAVLLLLWFNRRRLVLAPMPAGVTPTGQAGNGLEFLRIPAVWMCFTFFFFYAVALSGIQAFAPEAARILHGVPKGLVGICLTIYMVASAGGMVLGGFLAADPARCERIVGIGFSAAAAIALRHRLRRRSRRRRAVPVRRDGPGRRHRRAVARSAREALVPRERHGPGVRRRLLGARHRPGHRAAAFRHLDGPGPPVAGLARHRPGPADDGCERVPRPPRPAHGPGAGLISTRPGRPSARGRRRTSPTTPYVVNTDC